MTNPFDMLVPFGLAAPTHPRVVIPANALGDNPEAHRWRAVWDHRSPTEPTDIIIYPCRVVRLTPCGAWIDEGAYAEPTPDGAVWTAGFSRMRWVSNDGSQAWAKPTRAAALESIAVRLARWSMRLRKDADRVRAAAHALKAVAPWHAQYADAALSYWVEESK